MGNRAFKQRLYGEFAVIGKALASPHRLELLDLLAQGERNVDELATETELSVANASAHLQVLRRARLVESDKRGAQVFYRLADASVYRLWRTLRGAGEERLAEVERLVDTYLGDRRDLEAVTSDELAGLLEQDAVTLIDVRPVVEYRQGHIVRARSLPIEELERRLMEIPRDREVVAYCRGPYCVFADEALRLLKQHGYHARRLEDGFPEWRAAGLPAELGDSQRVQPAAPAQQA
ncbi:MAG TPA: metalloregulator ArsR/SmtB family transcription factor [Chloroflexota bacterium]|nr:metalloregulator ArsR/SmtB family transcription factor [Chloroflexota bacterium]